MDGRGVLQQKDEEVLDDDDGVEQQDSLLDHAEGDQLRQFAEQHRLNRRRHVVDQDHRDDDDVIEQHAPEDGGVQLVDQSPAIEPNKSKHGLKIEHQTNHFGFNSSSSKIGHRQLSLKIPNIEFSTLLQLSLYLCQNLKSNTHCRTMISTHLNFQH